MSHNRIFGSDGASHSDGGYEDSNDRDARREEEVAKTYNRVAETRLEAERINLKAAQAYREAMRSPPEELNFALRAAEERRKAAAEQWNREQRALAVREAQWRAGPPPWLRTAGWVAAGVASLWAFAWFFGGRR